MSYFNSFPKIPYSFGDGIVAGMQNLTVYAEVVDEIKNNGAFYQSYYIKTGERPDQLAYNIYDNPELHWTFYLLNDHIRSYGWPISQSEVLTKVKNDYPGLVLRTQDELFHKFEIGVQVRGLMSNATGTIVHRDLKLGHVVLEDVTGSFQDNELVENVDTNETITIWSSVSEHLAPRYYVDGDGEEVDFDPFSGVGELVNPITNYDHYIKENDSLRQIAVLKPDVVNKVVNAFKEAMRS